MRHKATFGRIGRLYDFSRQQQSSSFGHLSTTSLSSCWRLPDEQGLRVLVGYLAAWTVLPAPRGPRPRSTCAPQPGSQVLQRDGLAVRSEPEHTRMAGAVWRMLVEAAACGVPVVGSDSRDPDGDVLGRSSCAGIWRFSTSLDTTLPDSSRSPRQPVARQWRNGVNSRLTAPSSLPSKARGARRWNGVVNTRCRRATFGSSADRFCAPFAEAIDLGNTCAGERCALRRSPK